MSDTPNTNRRLWNEWSDAFQALWNADTAEGGLPPAPCPLTPDADGAHPDVVPAPAGVEFVELGCGGGQASVGTAAEGADRVVGVDFSAAQLDHARRLRDCYGVDAQFVAGDVTTLPLADDAFDVAFSGWVVQMIERLDAYLSEARRVLRADGVLGFDVPHPFYECFDPATESIERSYHGPPHREITIDERYDANLIVFDRPVSDLHNALVDAGFDVRRVLEPGSDDPEAYDDDPLDSNRPSLMAKVPRTLRFWATVR
ncbi:class I SAM-dependent methyltransferase [Haloplanus rubicundus]|uniref:Class I SAM-dependent methyltransferase n=1 Tax=Haloplanus rubicundus TaxID=1547898 RepID=A0A345EGL4_9EURY|nr:class I SAM-dependent methyltransferase [Haloplanus rubicundus]AXG11336.1 class I SAM-dependent methyltransferase [Haloplanus rubicundus]